MCAALQLALDPVFGSCFSIWSPWPGDARVCVTLKSTIMISVAITWFSLRELVSRFVYGLECMSRLSSLSKMLFYYNLKISQSQKAAYPHNQTLTLKNQQLKQFRNIQFGFSEGPAVACVLWTGVSGFCNVVCSQNALLAAVFHLILSCLSPLSLQLCRQFHSQI